jgi:8-oxo-dGTP pyrophosphatase MutT (NUDIX family)
MKSPGPDSDADPTDAQIPSDARPAGATSGRAAGTGAPETRPSPWTTRSSELVHANPWYSVRRDAVVRPDGSEGWYYVVVSSPAVFVVAVDAKGSVALVELHRYSVGTWSLEVPAGSVDPGETPLEAARRELAEEAGLAALHWRHLGVLHPANGLLAEDDHVYLATGLEEVDTAEQAAEGIVSVRFATPAELRGLAGCGRLSDSQTLAAILLAGVL